jgi:glycosyltransferase involved in cell wall biosynthesis
VAVLWVHFGPYHLARLRALRQKCEVAAIEFASGQQMYGWRSESNSEVITLDRTVYERGGSFPNAIRLWRVLNNVEPRYLFIPGYREPLAIFAAFWGKMHGRINVLMLDSTAVDLARNTLREKIKALIARSFFQKAFVSGKRSAVYLQSLSGRMLPFEEGYDVVDNAFFASRVATIRSNTTGGAPRPFLFVGRLAEVKNLPLLFDAYRSYKRNGGLRNLEIVGHGPMENSLKSSVHRAGLEESIRFFGFQPYDSIPAWYARSACLILPSISEPWGLVVNEAMASGLPVIVSDRCGCADDLVEDGINGYIFSAEDADSLTNRMFTFDALSEADRRAMGRRSQEIIARFSPETWADAVLRLVEGKPEGFAVA